MPYGIGASWEPIMDESNGAESNATERSTGETRIGGHAAHDPGAAAAIAADLRSTGVGILHGAFAIADVDHARREVLDNVGLMKNTRPNPRSRHLAGFHRFPHLEPLHHLITGNRHVLAVISALLGPDFRTIGLSDITIDRSQQWHKDLLRGRYRRHMDATGTCENHHGKVVKVIMYLQDSSSLQFVPGSHRCDIPLDVDDHAVPTHGDAVSRLAVGRGDAVVIDVCTTHRGSSDEELAALAATDPPRILVSTVFGRAGCQFTDRMEFGNAERLSDWQRREG